jgi:membrane protease YdiL (CAAX protease family)
MKGVRKRKDLRPTGIRIGRYVLPSQIAIAGLMALLYAWLLLGGALSRDSILLQLLYFALFLGVIYLLRSSQKLYTRLGYAFLVVAIPPLLWNVVAFYGYGPAVPDLAWVVYAGLANLLLGVGLVAVLLYYEKGRPSGIFLQAGNMKAGLLQGGVILVVSAILASAAAYILYDAGSADTSLLYPALGALLIFAIACGFVEELWFRGLLLSRLLPLVSTTPAIIIQAFAFAAYEAVFLYMLTSNPVYSLAVFVVAAALGAVWAWMTVRDKSIIAPALSHAGVYLILALPVFAAFF